MLCFVFYNTLRLFFDHAEWLILLRRKLTDFCKILFERAVTFSNGMQNFCSFYWPLALHKIFK